MKLLVNGYTVTEALELRRVDNELLKMDRFIGHLKRNKDKYILLTIIIALIIPSATLQVYATSDLGALGKEAYVMGKMVAKAICLVGWLTDSIKCVLTGTTDSLGKTSVKWISFAIIVKFLPSIVDWIFSV